jgi:hypothetical protein
MIASLAVIRTSWAAGHLEIRTFASADSISMHRFRRNSTASSSRPRAVGLPRPRWISANAVRAFRRERAAFAGLDWCLAQSIKVIARSASIRRNSNQLAIAAVLHDLLDRPQSYHGATLNGVLSFTTISAGVTGRFWPHPERVSAAELLQWTGTSVPRVAGDAVPGPGTMPSLRLASNRSAAC